NGNIQIYVRPKSQHDIEKFVETSIDDDLNKKLTSVDKNKNPIYSTSVISNGFEVYKPLPNAEKNYKSDGPFSEVIVLKDNKGMVCAYATCLPDAWCKKKKYEGLTEYYPYAEG